MQVTLTAFSATVTFLLCAIVLVVVVILSAFLKSRIKSKRTKLAVSFKDGKATKVINIDRSISGIKLLEQINILSEGSKGTKENGEEKAESETRRPTMAVSNEDVGSVVLICARHRERVRFGVLGAALSKRVGNPDAQPGNFGMAAGAMVKAFFGEPTPVASWVVDVSGYPPRDRYGNPPNEKYDREWSTLTPLHTDVEEFLEWLDSVSPGWDANLQSTYP